MKTIRQQVTIDSPRSIVAFDVPADVDRDALDRVTITLKSLQLAAAGVVMVRVEGNDAPPAYYSTSVEKRAGAPLASNSGFASRLRGPNDGLHGIMHLVRNYQMPTGGTDCWVAAWTFRQSQQSVIAGAGNTYFAGRIKRISVVSGKPMTFGNVGVLYG